MLVVGCRPFWSFVRSTRCSADASSRGFHWPFSQLFISVRRSVPTACPVASCQPPAATPTPVRSSVVGPLRLLSDYTARWLYGCCCTAGATIRQPLRLAIPAAPAVFRPFRPLSVHSGCIPANPVPATIRQPLRLYFGHFGRCPSTPAVFWPIRFRPLQPSSSLTVRHRLRRPSSFWSGPNSCPVRWLSLVVVSISSSPFVRCYPSLLGHSSLVFLHFCSVVFVLLCSSLFFFYLLLIILVMAALMIMMSAIMT